jgi:geranylgeranyl diphosphate synthase type II
VWPEGKASQSRNLPGLEDLEGFFPRLAQPLPQVPPNASDLHTFPELVSLFESRLSGAGLFRGHPDTLYEPCRYLIGLGGKRIRPVLCLMGTELFSELSEDAFHAALGIELFHNFTLIHDDIMDKAPLRRGQPALHARNGLTAGILCGDLMCIEAYSHLSRTGATIQAVLQLFNRTAAEVCEGQQLDMDFEQRSDVSVEEYIRMIELKTSVLLAASLKIGALIGGATEGAGDKLYAFGRALGIAFQLQDDYLDAFGEPGKLGKQAGGDILADKKTFLHLKAMERLTPEDATALQHWQGRRDESKVQATLALFRKSGADRKCREAVAHYSQLAFDALEEVAVVSKRKKALSELAEMLLERQA